MFVHERRVPGKWKVLRTQGVNKCQRKRLQQCVWNGHRAWRCLHGVVLRVVAELLRDGGVAEEEGEVGENVLTGGRNGTGSGEVPGTLLVLGLHLCWLVVTEGVLCVLLFGGSFRPTARLAGVCPSLTSEWNGDHILDSGELEKVGPTF